MVPGETTKYGGAEPSPVTWTALDVSKPEQVGPFFDAVVESFGRVDLLVNNAGVQRHGPVENIRWEDWAGVVDVNLHGVFLCLQQAGRHMLAAGGGAIVNIASVGARGAAGRAPYSATKAAVIALTATVGAEWASRGVRVNAVAPGYIDTGVLRAGVDAGTLDVRAIVQRIPAARLAQADEIASVVEFLASDAASYINGQTLYVDGGFMVDYGIPLVHRPGDGDHEQSK
jgi:3-oxoacyl-[acyl-carrier protein] reductase